MLKISLITLFLFINLVQAQTVKVALYPYVPRIEQFKTAISEQWKQTHPDDKIVFISDWDGGYNQNPPDEADIFVFDALFFEYFLANGFLEPMTAKDISDIDDFIEYAIEGVKLKENYYAIPQLGCTNILYYREGDSEVDQADSIKELNSILGECTYTSQIPPYNIGLMLDMKSGSTNASFYLDIAHRNDGKYPLPLPTVNTLNQKVIDSMRTMLKIASYENATQDTPQDYGRGRWYSKGYSRAFIGYTEHMSAMSEETRKGLNFKLLPMFKTNAKPLFYADVIGVNPKSKERGTKELSIELANLMASKETMLASIGPYYKNSTPQYLISVRQSVLKTLGEKFPIYKKIESMISEKEPILFKLGVGSKEWFDVTQDDILKLVRKDYKCGCDKESSKIIINDNMAKVLCPTICNDNGGWNGQWTNDSPMAPLGKSVCGCNKCTIKQ